MNVLISGSRDFSDTDHMRDTLVSLFEQGKLEEPWNLVCLMHTGAEECAYRLAYEFGLGIWECPSDEDVFGADEGDMQNQQAVILSHALVVFGTDLSVNVTNLMKLFQRAGKPVYRAQSPSSTVVEFS